MSYRIYGKFGLKMAIPFSLPSDHTTLEQYRAIHQLLLDLTAILHTLLTRNPEWVRPNATNAPNVAATPANNANPVVAPPPPPPAFNPATPYPQFGLPLSPPNSQPGSPSPFLTATAAATSAFILPDVVTSAARTLNELGPQPSAALPAAVANARQNQLQQQPRHNAAAIAGLSQRLRKRKRAKLSRRKQPQQQQQPEMMEMELEVGCGSGVTCERRQHRKMSKTTDGSTCSCFAAVIAAADDDDSDATLRQRSTSCCADVPRMLGGSECCCGQQLPSDYKVPVCMHVGEELRKIVECFRNPKKINESITTDDDMGDVKGTGFLSQFGRTMFTAALLVIGWKLLKQN